MTQPDTGAQSGADGTQSGAADGQTSTTNDSGTQSTGAQSGAADSGTQTATEPTISKAQHDQLKAQLAAADRKRQEAEGQLQQLRDKDLPEAERAKRELEGLRQENADLKTKLKANAINTQFLMDNTHDWHNPQAALALLDRNGLTVGDDYSVAGMKDALKALAAAHPYLLKTSASNNNDSNNNGGTAVPPMNGQPAGARPTADKKAQAQRFPAARSRLGNP